MARDLPEARRRVRSTFRLEFGERFDCGFCVLRCGDGWMVLDILRGHEGNHGNFLQATLNYCMRSAKLATWALAGWDREKNESSLSRALGTLFHYIDPKLDTRLQGRQQRRQVQRRQLRLMEKIRADWARRLCVRAPVGTYRLSIACVERYFREAKLLDIGAGTNEIRRILRSGGELIKGAEPTSPFIDPKWLNSLP